MRILGLAARPGGEAAGGEAAYRGGGLGAARVDGCLCSNTLKPCFCGRVQRCTVIVERRRRPRSLARTASWKPYNGTDADPRPWKMTASGGGEPPPGGQQQDANDLAHQAKLEAFRRRTHDMYEAVSEKPLTVTDVRVDARAAGGADAPRGLRTRQAILERELQLVYDAKSLREVHAALETAVEHLQQLEAFRRIDALIDEDPGVRRPVCPGPPRAQPPWRVARARGWVDPCPASLARQPRCSLTLVPAPRHAGLARRLQRAARPAGARLVLRRRADIHAGKPGAAAPLAQLAVAAGGLSNGGSVLGAHTPGRARMPPAMRPQGVCRRTRRRGGTPSGLLPHRTPFTPWLGQRHTEKRAGQ